MRDHVEDPASLAPFAHAQIIAALVAGDPHRPPVLRPRTRDRSLEVLGLLGLPGGDRRAEWGAEPVTNQIRIVRGRGLGALKRPLCATPAVALEARMLLPSTHEVSRSMRIRGFARILSTVPSSVHRWKRQETIFHEL